DESAVGVIRAICSEERIDRAGGGIGRSQGAVTLHPSCEIVCSLLIRERNGAIFCHLLPCITQARRPNSNRNDYRQKHGEALPRTYNRIDEPGDRDRSEYTEQRCDREQVADYLAKREPADDIVDHDERKPPSISITYTPKEDQRKQDG